MRIFLNDMNPEYFWSIVDRSRIESETKDVSQYESLKTILAELDCDITVDFDVTITRYLMSAQTWDFWGAAYLIFGGCGDDGFQCFLQGILAAGKVKFEAAIQEPDSLADWVDPCTISKEILYSAGDADLEKTGKEFPGNDLSWPENSGYDWSSDSGYLERRFPKLWKRFEGWNYAFEYS